jgi:hypothetical protein
VLAERGSVCVCVCVCVCARAHTCACMCAYIGVWQSDGKGHYILFPYSHLGLQFFLKVHIQIAQIQ